MSKANPSHPLEVVDVDLARDMRRLAHRLDAQADKFEALKGVVGTQAAASDFRRLAGRLRIDAEQVTPSEPAPNRIVREPPMADELYQTPLGLLEAQRPASFGSVQTLRGNDFLRPATQAERDASRSAAAADGGVGAIDDPLCPGRTIFVEE